MSAAGAATPGTQIKQRAASLSIVSNLALIALKVVAGTLTGSVALLAEAMHSSIDLVASVVAWVSVRKAGEPADEEHRYGHEKIEHLAAAIEGLLILVGSAVVSFEAVRRLVAAAPVQRLELGIAVIAVSIAVNLVVARVLGRRARETESPALEGDAAHLRTDALSSVGVLVGLVAVQATGASWLDPVVALGVAGVILVAGVRLVWRSSRALVDEALPPAETARIEAALQRSGPRGVVGYHQLRTRKAGARRYVDLHVQFRAGTTLEDAHATAHALQDEIAAGLPGADVLIHTEPADRVRPGTEVPARPTVSAG